MIKFFRKIRYDLMEKNKTGKYLKYAIGEIVLVVIGILIALQINDWNENRKNQIRESKILNNLREDLERTKINLETTIAEYPEYIKRIETKINYIGMDSDSLTAEMKQNISDTGVPIVNIVDGSINALLGSEKLELLSNDTLKIMLTEYPTFVSRHKEVEEKLQKVLLDIHRPVLERYFSLTDRIENEKDKFPNLKIRAIPSDFNNLMKDRAYQNALVNERYHLIYTEASANELLSKTIKILDKTKNATNNRRR